MHRKQYILRPLALILAFVVGMASVGVSMDRHICQGTVKSIAFFGSAKTCLQVKSSVSASGCKHQKHKSCHKKEESKPCCHNERSYSKLSIDIGMGPMVSLAGIKTFLDNNVTVVPEIHFTSQVASMTRTPLDQGQPPLYTPRDIYALFQNFRL